MKSKILLHIIDPKDPDAIKEQIDMEIDEYESIQTFRAGSNFRIWESDNNYKEYVITHIDYDFGYHIPIIKTNIYMRELFRPKLK